MHKRKTFRPWQPEQTTLLPPSPREWLSEDHQLYFLLDLVDELDLSEILIPAQAKDPRGEKGFDPRMMTMLLLYAYCVGVVSSRKIERACYEDLAFRVLTGNQQPDHSRISEFRRRNLDALKGLFVQILRLFQKAGMVSLGHVALDGTKVQANASKSLRKNRLNYAFFLLSADRGPLGLISSFSAAQNARFQAFCPGGGA
jgi:transposase